MQVTAPSPIFYLPENLWSLLTRQGRELTVRVLQIEGKLLYLELGGHRFQARIAGTLNPEDFRSGDLLKVRVTQSEGPVVLEIVESSRGGIEKALLYLLGRAKDIGVEASSHKFKEISVLATLLKSFTERAKTKEKSTPKIALEDILGGDIQTSDLFFEEDRILIPFTLRDHRSWGYIEILSPEERNDKIRLFALNLFLEYLGYIKALFSYNDNHIEIELWVSENDTLEFFKEHMVDLKRDLSFSSKFVKINIEKRNVLPGKILDKIG
ncbi:MAG: hypothetical protein ABDI07_07090 [Candidatus Kryptonium sp.]